MQSRKKTSEIFQLYNEFNQAVTEGKKEAAVKRLQEFADQSSPNPEALLYLGYIYYLCLDMAKAKEFFSKIPKATLIQYLEQVATAAIALRALKTLAQDSSPDPDIAFLLGKHYAGIGGFANEAKAVDLFLKSPNNAQAQSCIFTAYLLGAGVTRNLSAALYYAPQSKGYKSVKKTKSIISLYNKEKNKLGTSSSSFNSVKDDKTKSKLNSGFDDQVIIDFMPSTSLGAFSISALALANKWNEKNRENPCHLLHARDLQSGLINYAMLNGAIKKSKVRIYIISHCDAGIDFICGDNDNNHTTADELAKALVTFFDSQNVIVNLSGCSAGKSSDATLDNSFGASLHSKLYALTNKNIPVVARTAPVVFSINHSGVEKFTCAEPGCSVSGLKSITKKQITYLKKRPGSKVIFQLNTKNQQIRTDGYALFNEKYIETWKSDAMQTINAVCDHTALASKKTLLKEWLSELKSDNSVIEIYNKIAAELNDPTSKIFLHSSDLCKLFQRPTNAKTQIKKLIERGALLPMIATASIQFSL